MDGKQEERVDKEDEGRKKEVEVLGQIRRRVK